MIEKRSIRRLLGTVGFLAILVATAFSLSQTASRRTNETAKHTRSQKPSIPRRSTHSSTGSPESQITQASGPIRLDVTVVDAETQKPVEQAWVGLAPVSKRFVVVDRQSKTFVTTDTNGRAAIERENLDASNSTMIVAWHSDYSISTSPLTQSREPLTVFLTKGKSARVRCVDENGAPIPGIPVRLSRTAVFTRSQSRTTADKQTLVIPGPIRETAIFDGATNDAGVFEVRGLDVGSYLVAVDAETMVPIEGGDRQMLSIPDQDEIVIKLATPYVSIVDMGEAAGLPVQIIRDKLARINIERLSGFSIRRIKDRLASRHPGKLIVVGTPTSSERQTRQIKLRPAHSRTPNTELSVPFVELSDDLRPFVIDPSLLRDDRRLQKVSLVVKGTDGVVVDGLGLIVESSGAGTRREKYFPARAQGATSVDHLFLLPKGRFRVVGSNHSCYPIETTEFDVEEGVDQQIAVSAGHAFAKLNVVALMPFEGEIEPLHVLVKFADGKVATLSGGAPWNTQVPRGIRFQVEIESLGVYGCTDGDLVAGDDGDVEVRVNVEIRPLD